jgi:hypothetical protein
VDGWISGWVDGLVGGWIDGWVDGWIVVLMLNKLRLIGLFNPSRITELRFCKDIPLTFARLTISVYTNNILTDDADINGKVGGWMVGWMVGWMGGLMDGWVDGWIHER